MIFFRKVINFMKNNLFVFDKIIIYKMDKIKEVDSSVIVKRANTNNIRDVLYFQDERYIDKFKNFLKWGDIGYLGYLDGHCIHRSWVVINEGSDIKLHTLFRRKLNNNEVFIHYCETAPSARGNNAYPYVISTIAKEFKDRTVLICVKAKNKPSIKGVVKAGFKPIESINIISLFGVVIRLKDKS